MKSKLWTDWSNLSWNPALLHIQFLRGSQVTEDKGFRKTIFNPRKHHYPQSCMQFELSNQLVPILIVGNWCLILHFWLWKRPLIISVEMLNSICFLWLYSSAVYPSKSLNLFTRNLHFVCFLNCELKIKACFCKTIQLLHHSNFDE